MDQSYQNILPYLRPQPSEADGLSLLVLGAICLGIIIGAGVEITRRYRSRQRQWAAFRKLAQAEGLSAVQTRLLMRIAQNEAGQNSLLLFNSIKAFDRQVGAYVERLVRRKGKKADGEIEAIAQIRRALGFDRDWQITSTHHLEPGQRVTVLRLSKEEAPEVEYILRSQQEDGLLFAPRQRGPETRTIEEGDEIQVKFHHAHYVEYRFTTSVLDVREDQAIFLRHARHLQRLQKRDFYRLDNCFDVYWHRLTKDGEQVPSAEELDLESIPTTRGSVRNISGGGLSAWVEETEAEVGDWLVVSPGFKGFFPLANVVCEVMEKRRSGGRWCVHVRFVDLPMSTQDDIIGKVNELQMRKAS